jgi:hypothetical protein
MDDRNPKSAPESGNSGAGEVELTRKEKQDYVEQVEEFEGPDRRERRGTEKEEADEPGVSRS